MKRNIINSIWNRNNRNGLNSNFEFLFEGVSRMNQLSVKADNTLKEAERINRINNDTNERLDNLIADSGTSSTEVVDARGTHTVLATRLNGIESQLAEISINPKTFGVVGDGATDDTLAMQQAIDAANGGTLHLHDTDVYLITDGLTLPTKLNVIGKGKFIFDGDVDFWLHGIESENITFEHLNGEVTKKTGRTRFNRLIRVDHADYFEVKNADITGAATAIHALFGKTFIAGNITIREPYGWDGTDFNEGYGVVTSARFNKIDYIYFISEPNTGRHSLYLNGDIWEKADIGIVHTENCRVFPISIVHSGTVKAELNIDIATFKNSNTDSSVASNGMINGAIGNNPNLKTHIRKVAVDSGAGGAVTFMGPDEVTVDLIIGKNLSPSFLPNTHFVLMRNGKNKHVGRIVLDKLATGFLSALRFHDVENGSFDYLEVGGDVGTSALMLLNSTVTAGTIKSNIEKQSGTSVVNYVNPLKPLYYGGSTPPADVTEIGATQHFNAPVKGGYIGQVLTADGWKRFGRIEEDYLRYGATSVRPSGLGSTDTGFMFYDTQLEKPIYWDGVDSTWRDAMGTSV